MKTWIETNSKVKVIKKTSGNSRTPNWVHSWYFMVGRSYWKPILFHVCFSFFVNLQNTMHMWPHPDIMLHVNPRFHASVGYGVIMNSWSKGKWGTEHKYPLLFTPGRPFSMKILCKRDEYLVTVDGVNLGAYRYLSSTHTVNTMYIEGDVFIKEVTVS